ncbi:MAG: 2,3-bisphosphoglycerate-independent phosphoglycerate mutase [Clostridia bacterium]|nr:2,3-bisphosphoglycerate-independent phosphoglycerate mutase [Clostridia bacterium]
MKKLCLVILDGYGVANTFDEKNQSNAYLGSLLTDEVQEKIDIPTITRGQGDSFDAVCTSTDNKFRTLFDNNPYTLLNASSTFVGLPFGQMGNSEVGHLNIGAGKVVLQDLLRINDAIKSGQFRKVLNKVTVKENASLHIVALVSNGGVHSSIDHLFAVIDNFKNEQFNICLHFISDGRDTDPQSAISFANQLEEKIANMEMQCNITIASLSGRYYAMDREKNFDRTSLYFNAITQNANCDESLVKEIQNNYNNQITDEFIVPKSLSRFGAIQREDTVIMLNYRADRMRQITQMLLTSNLKLNIYTMTSYSDDFIDAKVLFEDERIENNLSAILSTKNVRQLKVAEQSKYAHVTYFLNGGIEQPYKREDRVLVDMVEAKTFDLKPKMSAKSVAKVVKSGMKDGYDFIAVNFANCDMVGHTGVLKASEVAVKTVTKLAYELVKFGAKKDYIVVITADHGNAEIMQLNGRPHTAHTNNKVPFIVTNCEKEINLKSNGSLCNIMPTILELMEIEK